MKPIGVEHKIYASLAVMMFFIFITGISFYHLSGTWQDTMVKVNEAISEKLLLQNLRWNLVSAKKELRAHQTLDEDTRSAIREDIRLYNQFSVMPSSSVLPPLQLLSLPTEEALEKVLSAEESIHPITRARDEMIWMKAYSGQVALAITACMLVLGLIVTLATARQIGSLFKELKISRDLNIHIQELERNRIAQELHDDTIQHLIDLKRHYTQEKVDALIEGVRRVCQNLKPQLLEDLGLVPALGMLLENLEDTTPHLSVQVSLDEHLWGLPKELEMPVFRVIQELVTNIRKHAQATHVSLQVIYDAENAHALRIYLRDDGVGLDPQAALSDSATMGLRGVLDRVKELDGSFTLQSKPELEHGTFITILIPIAVHERAVI